MTIGQVLSIDAGTGGVRCLITDLQGRLVSFASSEWSYETPGEVAPLGKEFDPDKFWHLICRVVREALGKANAESILGVSATSQREGVVFLDKQGRELYGGPNIDLRALFEGLAIDSDFGQETYSISGHTPSFLLAPAKLKWFQANRPRTYERIATLLGIGDWIIYKLCGERVSEVSIASELGLVDIRQRQWSQKLIELLELPRGLYPPLANSGSLAGQVTQKTAGESGIPAGTPVSLGAADTQCGLVGMGVKKREQVGIVAGWSASVQRVTGEPIYDSEARIWTGCHALPGKWVLESSASESGSAYRWLKDTVFEPNGSSEDVYAFMDSLAQRVSPGAEGVLAFMGPSLMNMSRLGLRFGGLLFPVPLSVGDVQKANLIRAVLENLGYAIKANCNQLEEISGAKVKEIRIGGKLAKSRCFTQLLSELADSPVLVPETVEVTGLGAAMCAAVGPGMYSSLEEAMEGMSPGVRVVEPDPGAAAEYAELYQRWVSTSRYLERLSEELK